MSNQSRNRKPAADNETAAAVGSSQPAKRKPGGPESGASESPTEARAKSKVEQIASQTRGLPRVGLLKPRADRAKKWIYLVAAGLAAAGEADSEAKALALLKATLDALRAMPFFESQVRRLEMSLAAVDRASVSELVERAAVMRRPAVSALYQR